MPSPIDLVIVFNSKAPNKESAQEASREYENLLAKLKGAGLWVSGKKGARQGQVLVAVHCVYGLIQQLERGGKARDPKNGVSATTTESTGTVSPAERIRLVHQYVTTSTEDGGLGITPAAPEWSRISSIFVLHDHEYNDTLIKSWKAELDIGSHLDSIKDHFGESVALYFAFLTFYAKSLVIPTILGLGTYFFAGSFDILYTVTLLLWAVTFVEAWRIKERALAVKWGTTDVNKVETLRAEYNPNGDIWWKRELKLIASIPIIGLFAAGLSALITMIFLFEAFIAQLYTGPGHQHIGFAPTILFIITIPRFLSFYHSCAKRLTDWENLQTRSAYNHSLTLKVFALSGIVSYLNLVLSAFVYVPFGTHIMSLVHSTLSRQVQIPGAGTAEVKGLKWWARDDTGAGATHLIESLRGARLRNQMFAFTLTNQVINFVQEVVVPFLAQGVEGVRKGKFGGGRWKSAGSGSGSGKKKRVEWEDEKDGNEKVGMNKKDWEVVYQMRDEVGLEEYTLFDDYSEMVTQFGYVALWSTCWPLAPLSALVNNWVELRSDAFKITRLVRRPIPSRTESIGAWLDTLSFITWLSALVNAALIYLFNPHFGTSPLLSTSSLNGTRVHKDQQQISPVLDNWNRNTIMITTLLIALASSHAYIALRAVVRHVLERIMWTGSEEEKELEELKVRMREAWLEEHGAVGSVVDGNLGGGAGAGRSSFWEDEGLVEIQNVAKME